MSDPIDNANENAEAFTEFAIQSKRPSAEEDYAFWRKIEESERAMEGVK